MQPNRKPLNIWLCIATLVVLNLIVAIFEHPFPIWSLFADVFMVLTVVEYNRDIKKKITDNEVMEDERTIDNRKKYNQILLFWSIIIVMAVLAIMLLLGIKYVSIENIILAFCIILLGGFTFNSYLSKK
ncbi:hypothetical protein ABE402_14620 [Bacillus smithii]|uniref:hypothetical protein n=1 Tax=Bacillus smithii TaxID=1479 RepID=UPI003D219D21